MINQKQGRNFLPSFNFVEGIWVKNYWNSRPVYLKLEKLTEGTILKKKKGKKKNA